MLILICGQAGSGKSLYAETRLSEFRASPKIYAAMSKVVDEEMRERVKKHQAMRSGKGFITTENLLGFEIPEGSAILIESLTAWVANEMFSDEGVRSSGFVVTKIFADLLRVCERAESVVVVSDDVFSDGVEHDELTEEYVKALGELTVKIAEVADEVVEVVLGVARSFDKIETKNF